jgi:diaminopimelate decarboxylase
MIYDGLVKSDEELSLAVANDIQIINIESYDEAVRLEQIARQQNKVVAVGLRLAFPSKTGIKSLLGVTYDRFGSSVRNGEAERVAKFIIKSSHLKLIGLHCHTGSNQLTAKKYLVGVDLAVDFMKLLNDRYGVKITILNLGGGIGIKNIVFYTMIDLLKNFIRNALKQPIIYKFKESFNFGELCQAIVDRLHFKLDQQSLPHPTLHMEPGRALVGNTTDLLLSIINTKRTEVADWIIVDGGTNLLPVLTLFSEYHRIDVYPRQAEAKFKKTSLAGPLLYSADILASNRLLPEAETGDLALIRDVGAYCVVQSNQFLYPRAATIFVEDEEAYIVQRRETVEDILVRDII